MNIQVQLDRIRDFDRRRAIANHVDMNEALDFITDFKLCLELLKNSGMKDIE